MARGQITNPTGKGGPKPGECRNPGGLTKEQAKLRDQTRQIMFKAGPELANYLVSRIKQAGAMPDEDLTSIALKAIEHVIGKATDNIEISGKDGGPIQAVINFGKRSEE